MQKLHDVLVVGGGPVGSRVAFSLAKTDLDVAVLEKNAAPGHKTCCTGIVGQECMDVFGIDSSLVLNRANSASLISPSGRRIEICRGQPQAYILDRAVFDCLMRDRAVSEGVEYHFSTSAEDIKILTDRVEVDTLCCGKYKRFGAKALVIAAGFGSKLPERAGLGVCDDFAMGVQADADISGVQEVELYFGKHIAPGFFGWIVPTLPGLARVGLISRRNTTQYVKRFSSLLISRGKVASIGEFSYGGVPLKALRRSYGERVLIVGDAAGQIKPTTGGGIYYGLLCADMAASVLKRVLQKSDLSARRLSWYQREWMKKLGRELTIGYNARKLFEGLSDRRMDRLFEVIERNEIHKLMAEADDLSFDWHSKAIIRLARLLGLRLAPLTLQLLGVSKPLRRG